MKILIVEDSLLQATQIQILLKRHSVDEVYTAYNGEDAIELCKQHRFDIAVSVTFSCHRLMVCHYWLLRKLKVRSKLSSY